MPTINLRGDALDPSWVKAIMFFPSDEKLRDAAYLRARVEESVFEVDDNQDIETKVGTLRALLDLPSRDQFKPVKDKAAKSGLIAGDLMAMLYTMATTKITPLPSVNKAVHAYLQWAKEGISFGDGSPLPKSNSTVREAWSSHRSVSHFWAALRLNQQFRFARQEEIFWGDSWLTFLEVAAGLQNFGCQFVPARQKPPKSVLDISETWTLPQSISPRLLVPEQIPGKLVELLRGYKAPQALY